jgi:hypothetical protein
MMVYAVLLLEHNRGMRTSGVITLFWLISLAVDAVRMRTIILQYHVRCAAVL